MVDFGVGVVHVPNDYDKLMIAYLCVCFCSFVCMRVEFTNSINVRVWIGFS